MAFPWLKTGEGPPNKGKKMPEVQRQKLSDAKKRLIADGWKPWCTGKKFEYSEEHKAKLRENFRKATEAKRKYKHGDKFSYADKYVNVYAPDHPSCNSAGYIHEHRLIAERVLGRRLKRNEVVHHINGDRSDNRNTNLLICDSSYHRWLHNRMSELFQQAMFSRKEE